MLTPAQLAPLIWSAPFIGLAAIFLAYDIASIPEVRKAARRFAADLLGRA